MWILKLLVLLPFPLCKPCSPSLHLRLAVVLFGVLLVGLCSVLCPGDDTVMSHPVHRASGGDHHRGATRRASDGRPRRAHHGAGFGEAGHHHQRRRFSAEVRLATAPRAKAPVAASPFGGRGGRLPVGRAHGGRLSWRATDGLEKWQECGGPGSLMACPL